MSWLRDKFGRFSRSRPAAAVEVEETAPALSPMMRHAVSWLDGTPAGDRLAATLAESQPATKRAAEPEPEGTLLQLLTANVAAVTESPERLVRPDEELKALALEGYTDEGLREIVRTKSAHGFATLREAERLLESTRTPPKPVVGSGRSWRSLDRIAEAEHERAHTALWNGDYEAWERYSLPAALRVVRGG
jgi:hypothetical protein